MCGVPGWKGGDGEDDPRYYTPLRGQSKGVIFGWFDAQGVSAGWLVRGRGLAGSILQAPTRLRR